VCGSQDILGDIMGDEDNALALGLDRQDSLRGGT